MLTIDTKLNWTAAPIEIRHPTMEKAFMTNTAVTFPLLADCTGWL